MAYRIYRESTILNLSKISDFGHEVHNFIKLLTQNVHIIEMTTFLTVCVEKLDFCRAYPSLGPTYQPLLAPTSHISIQMFFDVTGVNTCVCVCNQPNQTEWKPVDVKKVSHV